MKTPYDFGAKGGGSDDTLPLLAWGAAHGGSLGSATDSYVLVMSPAHPGIRFGSGFQLAGGGKILMRGGWPSGYGISPADWTKPTGGVRIDGSEGACLVFDGPGSVDPKVARKGLGLVNVTDFVVDHWGVFGGASVKGGDSFSNELRGGSNGQIIGGRNGGDVRRVNGQEGSDGWHITPTDKVPVKDVLLKLLDILTSDDSVGVTGELPQYNGALVDGLTLQNCVLRAKWHSALKALIKSAVAGQTMQNVALRNLLMRYCRIELELSAQGAGVAVIGNNAHRATGCSIDGLGIVGGVTNVIVPKGGEPGWAAMQFSGVDRLVVQNHAINHFHRVAIDMIDCPGAVISGCPIAPVAPVPAHVGAAVIQAKNCSGAKIDVAKVRPGWAARPGLAVQQLAMAA